MRKNDVGNRANHIADQRVSVSLALWDRAQHQGDVRKAVLPNEPADKFVATRRQRFSAPLLVRRVVGDAQISEQPQYFSAHSVPHQRKRSRPAYIRPAGLFVAKSTQLLAQKLQFTERGVAPSASISRRRPATAATIRISFSITFCCTPPKRIGQHNVCRGPFAALPMDDFLNKKRHRSLGYQHRGV